MIDSPPVVAWEPVPGSSQLGAVRVSGFAPALFDSMKSVAVTDPRWASLLSVQIADENGAVPTDRPAILGAYQALEGGTLRFRSRFPLDATRRYRLTVDLDGPLGPNPPMSVDRIASAQPARTATVVSRIEPLNEPLPENLLKFYVYFDQPMGRGEAYSHLQLVDSEGKPLDHPFLELGEELWNPTGTRLTVLLDPGRIKRGLRPREELGPIFDAGRSYTLKVDPSWRDAVGHPLKGPASKTFRTGPADETSPDPKAWGITLPRSGTKQPLMVRFADTLDRATVASGLTLLDPRGDELAGTAEATPDGSGWRFVPDRPWMAGTYQVAVDADLEDLAGNSIRRPFEVDVQRDVPVAPESSRIRLPFVLVPLKMVEAG